MFLSLVIGYTVILSFPFWNYRNTPTYHPGKLVSLWYFFYTLPFLYVSLVNPPLVVHEYVLKQYYYQINDLLNEFVLTQSIGLVFLYLGIYSNIQFSRNEFILNKFHLLRDTYDSKRIFSQFYIFSIITFIFITYSLGGINRILVGAYIDPEFMSGTGHLIALLDSCIYISAISYSNLISNSKTNSIVTLLVFISYFIMLAIFGGRSSFILLILTAYFSYTIYGGKTFKLNWKNTLAIVAIFLYLIVAPTIRGNTQKDVIDFKEVIQSNFINLAKGNEYVSIQLSILGHFDISNIWMGKSYLDLAYAIIPSAIYENKPPIEEGLYFFNIVKGYSVTPPFPSRMMQPVGWPPGTHGILFANFHVFGLCLGYYILGLFYRYLYHHVELNSNKATLLMLYFFVIFKFELTNHWIFHLITFTVTLRVISTMHRFIRK